MFRTLLTLKDLFFKPVQARFPTIGNRLNTRHIVHVGDRREEVWMEHCADSLHARARRYLHVELPATLVHRDRIARLASCALARSYSTIIRRVTPALNG